MRRISRRIFLGSGLAAAAILPHGRLAAAAARPDLVDVSGEDARAMVRAAVLALGGIGKFVRRGDFVVIKPNAGFANPPEWATTTHPEVVAAIAELCLEAKAKQVTIVEFPLARSKKALERCGIAAALARFPAVKVKVLTTQDEFQEVAVEKGVSLKSVELAKLVLSADVLINVPQAKHHGSAGVSFGLKNAMGLIWDRRVFHQALELHQAIADLGTVVRPHLTLLDATRALLTSGPQGPGETVTPGRIVAGRQAASVDAYGLTLARFDQRQLTPADVPHIALAAKAGLGEIDLSKLEVSRIEA